MKPVKRSLAIAAALSLLLPAAAFAQEAEEASSPISWELAVTNDYVFRGLSQTDEGPAFQAGLTYTTPVGIYAGVWGSNVDFGPGDPDFEVDAFVGYNVDFNDSLNFDILFNRYGYPKAGASNYNELIAALTFAETYSVSVAYTDDVFNSSTDSWYYSLGASWGLPADFTLDVSAGVTEFEDGTVGRDYKDWSVGIGKSFGPLTVSAAYVGTDGKGRDAYGYIADNRLVVTLSVGQ